MPVPFLMIPVPAPVEIACELKSRIEPGPTSNVRTAPFVENVPFGVRVTVEPFVTERFPTVEAVRTEIEEFAVKLALLRFVHAEGTAPAAVAPQFGAFQEFATPSVFQ